MFFDWTFETKVGYIYERCKQRFAANADVAQLVEHHLAKVGVASSSLVIRSMAKQVTAQPHGGLAERRGSGLQSRIHGFESRTHLAK